MAKSTLPDNYRYQKAHTSKWAVFYGLNELVGFVRRTGVSPGWVSNTESCGFYYRLAEPHWVGPFKTKDEAGLALIERWTL